MWVIAHAHCARTINSAINRVGLNNNYILYTIIYRLVDFGSDNNSFIYAKFASVDKKQRNDFESIICMARNYIIF